MAAALACKGIGVLAEQGSRGIHKCPQELGRGLGSHGLPALLLP